MTAWLTSKQGAPYMFLAPVFAFGFFFFIVPLGFSAYISLTEWSAIGMPRWVGLANYTYLLRDDPFLSASLGATLLKKRDSAASAVNRADRLMYASKRARGKPETRVG